MWESCTTPSPDTLSRVEPWPVHCLAAGRSPGRQTRCSESAVNAAPSTSDATQPSGSAPPSAGRFDSPGWARAWRIFTWTLFGVSIVNGVVAYALNFANPIDLASLLAFGGALMRGGDPYARPDLRLAALCRGRCLARLAPAAGSAGWHLHRPAGRRQAAPTR